MPLGGSGAEWGAPPLVCLAWYGVGLVIYRCHWNETKVRDRCEPDWSTGSLLRYLHYHLMDGKGSVFLQTAEYH